MSRNFDLIVFDWDGTLMDSAAAIVRAIQAAAADLGLPVPSEARARHVIGLGLGEALRHALPGLPESEYPRMVARYRHHYLARDHELVLFAQAAETVAWLFGAGWQVAVATGKSRLGLERALRHSGLGPYFHATRCADESFSKPHPHMLESLMDDLGARPERTLMIGDTTHDLQMARNAGTAALAVAFGAHPRESLLAHAPLACLDRPEDLPAWLRENA